MHCPFITLYPHRPLFWVNIHNSRAYKRTRVKYDTWAWMVSPTKIPSLDPQSANCDLREMKTVSKQYFTFIHISCVPMAARHKRLQTRNYYERMGPGDDRWLERPRSPNILKLNNLQFNPKCYGSPPSHHTNKIYILIALFHIHWQSL